MYQLDSSIAKRTPSLRSSLTETLQSFSSKNRPSLFDGLQKLSKSTKSQKQLQEVNEKEEKITEEKIIALSELNTSVDIFNINSQIRLKAQSITEQDYRNTLADLLRDCDTDISSVFSSLYVKRPHIRGIISENMTLEEGTELFGAKFVDNEESNQLLGNGKANVDVKTDIYLSEELLLYRNKAEDKNKELLDQWNVDIDKVIVVYL
jgi:hypothetical protein